MLHGALVDALVDASLAGFYYSGMRPKKSFRSGALLWKMMLISR